MESYNTDTSLSLTVYSSGLGGTFVCRRFREYNIDLDLDTDANSFDIVLKNPDGVYTSLFSRYDIVDISLNGVGLLYGRIDNVLYHHGADNYIKVSGRSMSMSLIDNDALPRILYNVNPSEYIAERCQYYGIRNVVVHESLDIIERCMIGVGDTESAIIAEIIGNGNHIWSDYDTLHVGKWNQSNTPSYTLICGANPNNISGIPVLSLELTDDGTESYSECIIYGGTSGNNKIVGSYQNASMISKGIHRRMIKSMQNGQGYEECAKEAEEVVTNSFKRSYELQAAIHTKDYIIKPNTVVRVIDNKLKINNTFLVRKVTHAKDMSSGSISTIYMIPSEGLSDTLNNSGSITGR